MNAVINDRGMKQIADALREHHKLEDRFTPSMLAAWAEDAEQSFGNGNGCRFEIRATDTKAGVPIVVDIDPDGYDVIEEGETT